MKEKKIIINFKGKKLPLILNVVPKNLFWLGLMFKRKSQAKPLLFEFDREVNMSIHSFFVSFPFIAIWLDFKGKIIEVKRINPFNFGILPKRKYKFLIELPLSDKYDGVLDFIDAIGKI